VFNIFRRIFKKKRRTEERRRRVERRRQNRKALDDYVKRIQAIKRGEKNHEDT